jgi:hypothetical protein
MSGTHENGQPFLAVRQNSCSVRAFVLSGAHTELNFRFDVENSAISEWNPRSRSPLCVIAADNWLSA